MRTGINKVRIEKRLESGLESETGLEYYSPSFRVLPIFL